MSVSHERTADTADPSRTDQQSVTLANSVVELEAGPAGVVGVVRHRSGRVDYVGPLPDATIAALREVGR